MVELLTGSKIMQSSILLDNVTVEYAIYGLANRSIKKNILRIVSGKRFAQDVSDELTRVTALKNISLSIHDGERIGLIGSNGAGKTTLLRLMAGGLKPASGFIKRVGTTASLFDVSMGMNPEATGWDNISLRGLFLGLSVNQVRDRTDEIVEFCGLTPQQLSRPVRTYSSGMMMKLAFSISTSIHPEILLLDEWIGVGDAQFLEKAEKRMNSLVQGVRILVIASHHDQVVRSLCTKVAYLHQGELVAYGHTEEMLALYYEHMQV